MVIDSVMSSSQFHSENSSNMSSIGLLMRNPKPPYDRLRHLRREDVRPNVRHLQRHIAQLSPRALTSREHGEVQVALQTIQELLLDLEDALQLELLPAPQFTDAPQHHPLGLVPHAARGVALEGVAAHAWGDAHDDGKVDEVGGVLGVGADLEGDADVLSLGANAALDSNWHGTQRIAALVPHHRKVFLLPRDLDGVRELAIGDRVPLLVCDVLDELLVLLQRLDVAGVIPKHEEEGHRLAIGRRRPLLVPGRDPDLHRPLHGERRQFGPLVFACQVLVQRQTNVQVPCGLRCCQFLLGDICFVHGMRFLRSGRRWVSFSHYRRGALGPYRRHTVLALFSPDAIALLRKAAVYRVADPLRIRRIHYSFRRGRQWRRNRRFVPGRHCLGQFGSSLRGVLLRGRSGSRALSR
mmetsp:Transcript_13008/g.28068  ORF Transcript_13008/g.28068 Transcript_13008/m.28068 type:complete len:410 (+) Transcript_13008:210-1439(+)